MTAQCPLCGDEMRHREIECDCNYLGRCYEHLPQHFYSCPRCPYVGFDVSPDERVKLLAALRAHAEKMVVARKLAELFAQQKWACLWSEWDQLIAEAKHVGLLKGEEE